MDRLLTPGTYRADRVLETGHRLRGMRQGDRKILFACVFMCDGSRNTPPLLFGDKTRPSYTHSSYTCRTPVDKATAVAHAGQRVTINPEATSQATSRLTQTPRLNRRCEASF